MIIQVIALLNPAIGNLSTESSLNLGTGRPHCRAKSTYCLVLWHWQDWYQFDTVVWLGHETQKLKGCTSPTWQPRHHLDLWCHDGTNINTKWRWPAYSLQNEITSLRFSVNANFGFVTSLCFSDNCAQIPTWSKNAAMIT